MVDMNDSKELERLQKELFPNRDDLDYMRYGFCSECSQVLFMDPPGGPFESLKVDCNKEGCKHKEVRQ